MKLYKYKDYVSQFINESSKLNILVDSICKRYHIENYTINVDGSVDVNGNVNLSHESLSKLPLKFGIVYGYFNIYGNNLVSLEGCPYEVTGNFICSTNDLNSLEGCPQKVGGRFDCSYNKLTSLKGSPEKVRDFICTNNQLTSLEGSPSKVCGWFDCYSNRLESLKGCPKEVVGSFNCSYNQLTSLEGCPSKVGGSFNCSYNQLTSLEGCPKKVIGGFDCSYNKLKSLVGSPKEVTKDFKANSNILVTLEGGPNEVGGRFECYDNKVSSLKDIPTKSNHFSLSANKLEDVRELPEGINFDIFKNPVIEIFYLFPNGEDDAQWDDINDRYFNFYNKWIDVASLLNEYNVIRDDKKVVLQALELVYDELGLEVPENIEIKGYEII